MFWTLFAAFAFLAQLLGVLLIVTAIGLFFEAELAPSHPPAGWAGTVFRFLADVFGFKDPYGAFLVAAMCELLGVAALLVCAGHLALVALGH